MLDDAKRNRPGGPAEAISKTQPMSSPNLTASAGSDVLARRHRYGVYVLAERADGRVVGQVYTSLPPGERKVARARERGLRASITLVELRPVGLSVDTSVVPSAVELLLDDEVV